MIANQTRRTPVIHADLAAFEQHKKGLLAFLRNVHKVNSSSVPFDANTTWHRLRGVAGWYFERIKQRPMLPARRKERLKDLAKALNRAHKLACKALQDEVREDLYDGFCLEANLRPALIIHGIAPINEAVAAIANLETAARRGAREIPTKPGPRIGTGILSFHDTLALQRVYRTSTAEEPILGPGPFADFVTKFLVAVGQEKKTANDYVVEHFNYFCKRTRKEARKIGVVPFFDK